eukprot:scaffold30562_cov75-Phaeocystis_antarctica.AAC.2
MGAGHEGSLLEDCPDSTAHEHVPSRVALRLRYGRPPKRAASWHHCTNVIGDKREPATAGDQVGGRRDTTHLASMHTLT